MENKLDVLTKKLYEEGVEKARSEADAIINKAKADADCLLAEAEKKALEIKNKAESEAENLKKKAEAEMALSARQAIAALRQSITTLISGNVAGKIAETGFEDKVFIQKILLSVVQKWDVASGNLDLEIILSEEEKKQFEAFIAENYRNLLDKGLEIKVGELKDSFVIQPKDGSYQITFSEELFESFFARYIRSFTKTLLYK